MPVRIVTDSTSDLPSDIAAAAGITVVPLNVHFGTETFRDGVDIKEDEFYRRLVSTAKLPTTSQPSVGAFLETYERLAPGADGIVSVHLTAKLSGTYNSAIQAKGEFKGCPVEVIDTQQGSLGLGMVALAAARAAQAGGTMAQVSQAVQQAMRDTKFFGAVDTLDYLVKGGRVGKAQAFVGGVLRIKPIITIQDGVVHPVERVRTLQKAVERLAELARAAGPVGSVGVIHSTTPDVAQSLADRVRDLAPGGQVLMSRFGPVIGAYLGPGAVGVAVMKRG
ncbi:MAG: DegV family protein [Dehalococcoidia bacterium]|nr:DegV family protein [Dehalococcoidia bacterium]